MTLLSTMISDFFNILDALDPVKDQVARSVLWLFLFYAVLSAIQGFFKAIQNQEKAVGRFLGRVVKKVWDLMRGRDN